MSELLPSNDSAAPDYQAVVLKRLAEAAGNGLALANLVDPKPAIRVSQEKVLRDLEKSGAIRLVRKGNSKRYWLAEHVPPQVTPEEKADEVLRRVLPEQRGDRLLTLAKIRDELLKGLGIQDAAIRTCLRVLEQEGVVVKLVESNKTYYAHVPALRALLDEVAPTDSPKAAAAAPAAVSAPAPAPAPTQAPARVPDTPVLHGSKFISARELLAGLKPTRAQEPPLPLTNHRVIEAYRSVRLQRRLPDVEIARLAEVLNCSTEELKPLVLRLCEQGDFIPGKGDWSFATAAARAAAVLIQGEPHLFVRMKEGT